MRYRIPPSPFSQRELHLFHQASLPSGTRGCNRPTVLAFLPLRLSCKESSTSNQAFSMVFTTPSVPLVGDRNLRRKDVTALRCSELLRSKVGGPSKVFAMLCGMGPQGGLTWLSCLIFKRTQIIRIYPNETSGLCCLR